jgi:uncharacterized protein
MRLQNIRMWIERKYEKTLQEVFRQFPVVVLTGARQVGKTSLVRKVFPDFSYATLDLPAAAEQAEKSPLAFLKSYQEPLIVDEVQYAPALFRHLKSVIDQDRRPGRFILTGSQNLSLMQGVSESLAGRSGVLTMLNLSFEELKSSDASASADEFLFRGGFPELYERQEIDSHIWFASYLSTYLERDVRNILSIGSLRDFDRFLRAAALRTGQILSYSELARDVGIAPNTAKSWISVLEASGQLYLLEPYHRNLGKRLIKSPKLYLTDTGLAAFLMGFESVQELFRSPLAGALWETHVIMETVRHFAAQGKRKPLWFWRTVQGAEVDLLIEQGGQFVAIETKLAEHPGNDAAKGFKALKSLYGEKSLIRGYVACRTPQPYPLTEEIHAIPGSNVAQVL